MTSPTRLFGPVVALAVLCLVIGTTGGAVAGALITGADIKDGTVTTKDVKDRTLKTSDLSKGAVAGLAGPRGATGPTGPPGADGQPGYQQVTGTTVPLAPGASATVTAQCPAGTSVLGGTVTSTPPGLVNVVSGGPSDLDEWALDVANATDTAITATAHANCTAS